VPLDVIHLVPLISEHLSPLAEAQSVPRAAFQNDNANVARLCSEKRSRVLQRADHYFKSGDYDKAKIEYLSLLRLDCPTHSNPIDQAQPLTDSYGPHPGKEARNEPDDAIPGGHDRVEQSTARFFRIAGSNGPLRATFLIAACL
jgi:hypothetical protein